MSARIWVTGGHGFLGRAVVKALEATDAQVFAPSHVKCDLRFVTDVCNTLRAIRPDIIVHLAASVGGIGANTRYPADFLRDNLLMGTNLLEAAKDWGVAKVVCIGSVCAYPHNARLPLTEGDIWNGLPHASNAAYGIAKRALLAQGQAYRQQYGLNVVHLLLANLYGAGDKQDSQRAHVVSDIIRKCETGRKTDAPSVVLWGDGSATRDLLYVSDAAEAIVKAVAHYDCGEPVNIGTGIETSIKDLAALIKTATGYTGAIAWDTSQPNGQPRRVLDVSRAKVALGWEAKTSLPEGIALTVADVREHA